MITNLNIFLPLFPLILSVSFQKVMKVTLELIKSVVQS
jgi:hypothetical protein